LSPCPADASLRDLFVESLGFCQREEGLRLYVWVFSDNHFHALVSSEQLPRVMADLKKFTAGKLIALLEAERRTWLLDLLAACRAKHKTSSTYQLWQEGCHPQAIYSDEVMLQKIHYVHLIPVRRGWVASPEHWRYSSAHEFLPGALPLLRCDRWC
jgi:hypothetical protein